MGITQPAAIVFALFATGVIAFQFALALGAPWGSYAMGGAFPGRFPAPMRIAAVVQGVLIGLLALAVLSVAGVGFLGIAAALPWVGWVAVAVSAVALVLNTSTRSAGERRIWAPVALVMLISSVAVALTA